jgi:hypothetical protein
VVRTVLHHVHWAVIVLALSGCETFNDGPVEILCKAECEDCERVVLQCDGTGRDRATTKTKSPVGG